MMKDILDNPNKCTGCGACYNSCSHHAIEIVVDKEGFEIPRINESKCVSCGLCKKSCPVINKEMINNFASNYSNVQKGIVVKSLNDKYRKTSSSGGVFPVIAKYIIEKKGHVFGAVYDNSWMVVHSRIDSTDQLANVQGSKYLQSKINYIFMEIKRLLLKNKQVLFVGMSCQVAGLRAFLGKDYDNLICIDLICMGIPSPGVWKKYLKYVFKNEDITFINFKDKTYGWHNFSLLIKTSKRIFHDIGMENKYMQAMFKSYSIRKSCFSCNFKMEKRVSDLTIADAWGCQNFADELDDNKGLSSVIIHSTKGLKLINEIKEQFILKEVSVNDIKKGNMNLVKSIKTRRGRKLFYFFINHGMENVSFEVMCGNPKKGLWNKIFEKCTRS